MEVRGESTKMKIKFALEQERCYRNKRDPFQTDSTYFINFLFHITSGSH